MKRLTKTRHISLTWNKCNANKGTKKDHRNNWLTEPQHQFIFSFGPYLKRQLLIDNEVYLRERFRRFGFEPWRHRIQPPRGPSNKNSIGQPLGHVVHGCPAKAEVQWCATIVKARKYVGPMVHAEVNLRIDKQNKKISLLLEIARHFWEKKKWKFDLILIFSLSLPFFLFLSIFLSLWPCRTSLNDCMHMHTCRYPPLTLSQMLHCVNS